MTHSTEVVGNLNAAVSGAVNKKTNALDSDFARLCVRAILAGVYLAFGTAFAGFVGELVNGIASGLGSVAFSFQFGFGLFFILSLVGN